MRFGEEIQTGDQLILERLKNILDDSLTLDVNNRPDFIKLFTTNLSFEREKIKFFAFIQDNSLNDLQTFFKKESLQKNEKIKPIGKEDFEKKIKEVVEENEILKTILKNYEEKWGEQIE